MPIKLDQNNSNELSSEDAAKQEATLKAILDAILPWLPQFTELLVNPPLLAPMNTTAGLLDPPLGQTRLSKKIFPWFNNQNVAISSQRIVLLLIHSVLEWI